jgi:two-component system, OmpR family, response regulator
VNEPHILVVDDHHDIREPLAAYLRKHGMRVNLAADAAAAHAKLAKHTIDLIVLDIMMLGVNRIPLCLHESLDISIILLTAVTDTDRIVGLDIGADDYVTKPLNPRELLAPMKNELRQANSLPKKRAVAARRNAFDRWILDTGRRGLTGDDGIAVVLSTAEFRPLIALVERPRLGLARDQLLDLTSGCNTLPFDRSMDSQISRLRRKAELEAADPQPIKAIWGDGYQRAADVREVS